MSSATVSSPRQRLIETFERENSTTMKVLRAFPKEKSALRPHPKAKDARELAWAFVVEQGLMHTALTTGFDFSKPFSVPPPPESFDAVLNAVEAANAKTLGLLRSLADADLGKPVRFFVGPGKMGDIPLGDFLWTMLHDEIHHRGQFSVYLRMSDAKVPSIYGPSLDEPWM